MSKILCLDTATDICTVSLFENGACVSFRDSGNERTHATQLALFIDEVLKETCNSVADLDAIAISMGPGSYTGLRIGVSTAKGLCYGANVPLIAVSTLQSMCYGITEELKLENNLQDFYFCPMLDARRMEVYSALYAPDYSEVRGIQAEIIDDDSYRDLLQKKKIVYFGTGSEKTKEHIKHANAIHLNNVSYTSRNMYKLAEKKLETKQFEDVAYFEPFYLKDFVATTPRKNILG